MTESLLYDAKSREYVNSMSKLILDHGLRDAPEDSDVRRLAKTLTQALLRGSSSDGGNILWLLYQLDLISKSSPVVNLKHADLSWSRLNETNLSDAALSEADLSKADLQNADLHGADLPFADLSGANLSGAELSRANLSGAEGITNEELDQQAKSLENATMPNGQSYEDWLKDKARKGEKLTARQKAHLEKYEDSLKEAMDGHGYLTDQDKAYLEKYKDFLKNVKHTCLEARRPYS